MASGQKHFVRTLRQNTSSEHFVRTLCLDLPTLHSCLNVASHTTSSECCTAQHNTLPECCISTHVAFSLSYCVKHAHVERHRIPLVPYGLKSVHQWARLEAEFNSLNGWEISKAMASLMDPNLVLTKEQ